jgi:hypothetical protein
MLTSEDVSLFWDRLTTWLFSQKVETIMLVGLLSFLCWMLIRTMDENTALQNKILEISREKMSK